MNINDLAFGLPLKLKAGAQSGVGTALAAIDAPESVVGRWLQFALSPAEPSREGMGTGALAVPGREESSNLPVLKPLSSGAGDSGRPCRSSVPLRWDQLGDEMSQLYAALEGRVPEWIESGYGSDEGYLAQPYALGITSAVAGEGKTTIALHLALHIARNTLKRVCVLDLSLGEDALSRLLGVSSPQFGLTDLLEQREQRISALQIDGDEGPVIMLAGAAPGNPSKVARSRRVCELMLAVRRVFDIVLVELPAVLTGNALPLTLHMDGLVMVTRAGATPDHVVHRAMGHIGEAKLLGVVLNGVKSSSPKWVQRRLLGR